VADVGSSNSRLETVIEELRALSSFHSHRLSGIEHRRPLQHHDRPKSQNGRCTHTRPALIRLLEPPDLTSPRPPNPCGCARRASVVHGGHEIFIARQFGARYSLRATTTGPCTSLPPAASTPASAEVSDGALQRRRTIDMSRSAVRPVMRRLRAALPPRSPRRGGVRLLDVVGPSPPNVHHMRLSSETGYRILYAIYKKGLLDPRYDYRRHGLCLGTCS
jgi:hypothetical protein